MAASLTNDRGNTDRLAILLDECRHMGLPVLPPDVNESALSFTPTDEGIRFGMTAIKNVGEGAAEQIAATRASGGPFRDLFGLCARIDLRLVNRRVLESLIAAGAMDSLQGHRAQQLAALDLALKAAQRTQEERQRGQISLFGTSQVDTVLTGQEQELPAVDPWPDAEKLAQERELLGFYISGHPLDPYARDLRLLTTLTSELGQLQDGAPLRVGGLVTRVARHSDRNNQPYAFITVEDAAGAAEVAFFSEVYATHQDLVQPGAALLVEGRLTQRNGRTGLQAEHAMSLAEARQQLTRALNISLDSQLIRDDLLKQVRAVCEQHKGSCELVLCVRREDSQEATVRSRTLRVNPCDELLQQLEELVGPRRIRLSVTPPGARPQAAPGPRRFRAAG